ncbi:PTS sugar transporter subunit IIA [Brevibacillus laterosporus]|uniref:Mannitol-specific phosphotransferase enzyme IIA component n=1 Tax=Brevibacillus laterosporus TaxID=1465 RepID=A0AAP3GBD1_BRELA|nr:PTS sugar transporter subunit IIA [Brevibacillus laterosporus]ATO50368.1 PTS mannitol transporter subunit IIA [Brevibacillus laterosporus DSM 25]MBG9802913.1 PTS mannitol transporter subunit IIA [Brevibacillus laterosporus]MCR8979665.1 PTS sugar transporter subunit IIA [Brevibacillus laterosporus]MCZ0806820.1 PTS sugar transporter subunit IIA [Brevibacillus laterosporus]MCZ0825656.1 PTS sugar transporter subunit IIA [Brevibacillus laterosporus]
MTNIVIARNQKANNKQEAIELAGKLLVQAGHVEADYINKMQEREEMLTTYLGNGVAIPHGTNEAKTLIKSTGISIVQLPEGVDFGDGNKARLLIGIAGVGDEHLDILSDLAIVVSEEENVEKLVHATTDEEIMDIIKGGM